MRIFLYFLGLVLVGLTVMDVFWTTLGIGTRGGPITGKVCNWLWKVVLCYHRGASSHKLLAFTGYSTLVISILLWIFLTWVGWTLIFSASDRSLISSDGGKPANIWERIYFTGYTLVTLGLGDFKPQGIVWQLATATAAANGFFLITLAITYLFSVLSAVTQKRQLAAYISSLGRTADEIVTKAWNGKDFGMLAQHLVSLTPMLALYRQHQLAYPVIHYFHSVERQTAAEVCVVVLDEALTLLEYGVKPEYRPDAVALYAARHTLSEFLETLKSAFIKPTADVPPVPNLEQLRAGGIPTVSDEAFEVAIGDLNRRRRLLLALIKNDGWYWKTVINPFV